MARRRPARFVLLHDARAALWLGLLTARGAGLPGLVRIGFLGLGTAAGCLLVLAAVAVPGVVDAQHERMAARQLIYGGSHESPAVTNPARTLRMNDIEDAIDSRPLIRVATAGVTPSTVPPPGVVVLPSPGEAVLSPALVSLVGRDSRARQRFPQRIVGTIAPNGLVAPDELYAYVGVNDSDFPIGTLEVLGYGRSGATAGTWAGVTILERFLNPELLLGYAFALFLLAPLAVLIGVCSRLAARVRETKLAGLRLLGLTQAQVQLAHAVDIGLIALVGATLGYATFSVVGPGTSGWSVGRFHWFSDDLGISPTRAALVVSAFTVFAVLVASLGTLPAVRRPLAIRRSAPAQPPTITRMLPLSGGIVATVVAVLLGGAAWQSVVAFGLGLLLIAVGLPLALPVAVHAVAGRIATWQSAPLWMALTARRWRHTPAATPRLAAGITTTIFVAGVGLLAANWTSALQSPTHRFADSPLRLAVDGGADAPEIVRELRALGIEAALYEKKYSLSPDGSRSAAVVHADCADLAFMFTAVNGSCVNGQTYRLSNSDPAWTDSLVEPGSVWHTEDGDRLTAPQSQLSIRTSAGALGDAALLVAQSAAALHSIYLDVPPHRWDEIAATAAQVAPARQVVYPLSVRRGLDSDAVLTVLGVGAALALSIGLVAFAIASVDHVVAAGRRNVALSVIGTPRRLMRLVECASVCGALVVGTIGALAALSLVSWAARVTTGIQGSFEYVGVSVPTIAAVGIAAVLVVLAISSLATGRTTAELLRHE